jgi:hypothetical protein
MNGARERGSEGDKERETERGVKRGEEERTVVPGALLAVAIVRPAGPIFNVQKVFEGRESWAYRNF